MTATDVPAPADPRATRRDRWIAALAVVLPLALFSGKAFTIDDPLFLWLAQHLAAEPFDFYGFEVNWYGTPMGMWEVTKNPPLTGYYLALVGSVFGWSERALHLAFLLPAAACALATYGLAQRFSRHPLAATLVGLATPVFLVSSTNVMSDGPMLALWCWALLLWVRFLDGRGAAHGWAAAALAGLAGVTKYFALALLPLFVAYALLRRRPWTRWAPPLVVPVALWAGYQLVTASLYGRGLLLDAAQYATTEHWEGGGTALWARTSIGLAFAGGCLLPALAYLPLLAPRALVAALLVLAAAGAALGASFESWSAIAPSLVDAPPWHYAAQYALLSVGGLALLGLVAHDLRRRRDADAALLALWVLGTFFFATYVNWVNNGRSNLPMAPALGILVARRWSERAGDRSPLAGGGALAFAAAAAVALCATWADARWAGGVRTAARELARENTRAGEPLYFLGHWGFQWYMEEAGAVAVDLNDQHLRPGDRLVLPMPGNNTHVYPPPRGLAQHARRDDPTPAGPRTMSRLSGAGFYASNIGPLPFVFAGGLVEDVYLVGNVVQDLVYDDSFDLQVERL